VFLKGEVKQFFKIKKNKQPDFHEKKRKKKKDNLKKGEIIIFNIYHFLFFFSSFFFYPFSLSIPLFLKLKKMTFIVFLIPSLESLITKKYR